MFGRRSKKRQSDAALGSADEPAAPSNSDDAAAGEDSSEGAPAGGPWDSGQDVPEQPRIDFGSVRIPVAPDIGVSWEVDKTRKRVTAVRVMAEKSMVRVQAFAAPKSEGLWKEARAQLAAGINQDGGKAQEFDGPFGTELRAVVPLKGKTDDQGRPMGQRARFIGVDGPRWLLRASIQGAAATNAAAAARIEEIVRGIIVVRGSEPKPPKEALELRLSAQTQELLDRARERANEQESQDDEAGDGPTTAADPDASPEAAAASDGQPSSNGSD